MNVNEELLPLRARKQALEMFRRQIVEVVLASPREYRVGYVEEADTVLQTIRAENERLDDVISRIERGDYA